MRKIVIFRLKSSIRGGFTDELKEFVVQLNAFVQESNPDIRVHTPQPTTRVAEKYIANGIRKCTSSVKDGDCPYGAATSMSTSQLQLHSHVGGKVLRLNSRCFLCVKIANLRDFRLRLGKENNGVLLCSQTLDCQNPHLPGRLQCQQCADTWNETRAKREMKQQNTVRKPKFSVGSLVKDSITNGKLCREPLDWSNLGTIWMCLFERIQSNPADVYIIDTEAGFDGVVHGAGSIMIQGDDIVNDVVNYGCQLDDFYKSSQESLPETQRFRVFCAINKTDGPTKKSRMPGSTPTEILEQFKAAGMSEDSLLVEHSFGNFDYNELKELASSELSYILPKEKNFFPTLTLWRLLLSGLFSHKQSHIFTLLCPTDLSKTPQ